MSGGPGSTLSSIGRMLVERGLARKDAEEAARMEPEIYERDLERERRKQEMLEKIRTEGYRQREAIRVWGKVVEDAVERQHPDYKEEQKRKQEKHEADLERTKAMTERARRPPRPAARSSDQDNLSPFHRELIERGSQAKGVGDFLSGLTGRLSGNR